MEKYADKIFIELFDKWHQPHKYEILDIEEYANQEYVILLPCDSGSTEVEIFRMKHSKDKSATFYDVETNNYVVMQVYEMFKEKYQRDYPGRIIFQE